MPESAWEQLHQLLSIHPELAFLDATDLPDDLNSFCPFLSIIYSTCPNHSIWHGQMDVTRFFNRLRQPAKPAQRPQDRQTQRQGQEQDDVEEFEQTWVVIKETLEHPDERQIIRGIKSTSVPSDLQHLVDALVYEGNRLDEDETGPCFEYFLRHDLLANLERLCEQDRPHGIKAEVLKAIDNLVVLLSDRFLMHNAVHRPLRRLLRSCVGGEPAEVTDGTKRLFGAASLSQARLEGASSGYDAELVDLMCILCAKMRAHPTLLLIFFHDKGWLQPIDTSQPAPSLRGSSYDHAHRPFSPSPSHRTGLSDPSARHSNAQSRPGQRFEFLLFSYMLRFVHREGRTGDFARAGLLFLFDIAFVLQNEDTGDLGMGNVRSQRDDTDQLQMARNALAEYILDGDFADVMAAAVGAVYSLLPRKVKVPTLADQAGGDDGTSGVAYLGAQRGIVGEEVDEEESDDLGLPSTQDLEVYEQLDLLLKLFGLMQDIVNRCTSLHAPVYVELQEEEDDDSLMQALGYAIADSILDAMQRSLLNNVLYPSILECSPKDGSSVAVMTYLDVLLRNLDDGPLLSRLLDYLFDLENGDAPLLDELQLPIKEGSARFTLKDLILDNLAADEPTAKAAASRLTRTLLVDHCAHSARGLLSTIRIPDEDLSNRVGSSSATSAYNAILIRLDPTTLAFDQSSAFSTYFSDAYTQISTDRCLQLANLQSAFLEEKEVKALSSIQKATCTAPHTIASNDSVLQAMLGQLGTFLANDASHNVALTGALLGLAMCGNRSLEGVFVPERSAQADVWGVHARGGDDDDVEVSSDDSSADFFAEGDDGHSNVTTAVLDVLRGITDQIAAVRRDIANFDSLLADQRRALMFDENIDDALDAAMINDLADSPQLTPTATTSKSGANKPPSTTPVPKRGRVSLAGSIKDFFSPKKKSVPDTPTRHAASADPQTGVERDRVDSTMAEGGPVLGGPPPLSADGSSPANRKVHLKYPSSAQAPQDPDINNAVTCRTEVIELDTILDNIVILEEWLKEIMGILAARRALGVT